MRCVRNVALGVVASLALAGFTVQQSTRGEDPAPKDEAKTAKPRAKPRGRLPAHYGAVVDEEQREKIYGIQASYQPQFEALETQLTALREKQTAEIEAILRPEQKEKVKELTAAAKAKRAKAGGKAEGDDSDSSDADAPPAGEKAKETKAKKAS